MAYTAFAYLQLGQLEEASKRIDASIKMIDSTGEMMLAEDLYRIAGMVRLQCDDDADGAEALFRKSLDYARQHGTRAYELRTGICLARLWREQGRKREARNMLASTYEWFTEGFDTVDLREGKALLDALR